MKKYIFGLLAVLLVIALGIGAKLFIIGEPVDGNTIMIEVEDLENQINIHIATPASAIAFSDVNFRHEGTVLHITVREVLVSSLHNSGTKSIYVEKVDETEVWLGGKLIWTSE